MLFSCSIVRYSCVTWLQITSAKVLVYMISFNSNDPFPSKFLTISFSQNCTISYFLLLQIPMNITVQCIDVFRKFYSIFPLLLPLFFLIPSVYVQCLPVSSRSLAVHQGVAQFIRSQSCIHTFFHLKCTFKCQTTH